MSAGNASLTGEREHYDAFLSHNFADKPLECVGEDGQQSTITLGTVERLAERFQRMFPPGWSQAPANHKGRISVKTPQVLSSPVLTEIDTIITPIRSSFSEDTPPLKANR
jgi:hypothetical protein